MPVEIKLTHYPRCHFVDPEIRGVVTSKQPVERRRRWFRNCRNDDTASP
jgi:hypothetical protein